MDSPYTRSVHDSPFLRAQEGKYGHNASFSLGPGMHEPSGFDASTDTPQSTADLTAFVQNLLQQMQLRFQSMSDAILARIDEMASRIEEMERAVDEVLREVNTSEDDQVALPSPSSSPIRRSAVAPASPVRKYSIGPPGSFPSVSPLITRYSSGGAISSPVIGSASGSETRRPPGATTLNVPGSPDLRRHSNSTGTFIPGSPDPRRQSLPNSGVPGSPDIRRASQPSAVNFPSSPDNRRRQETHSSGIHLR